MINFIKKNRDYFITIASVFAIVMFIYIVSGVFPFGGKTIAHYDMMAQTIPLSELVYDWIGGESPLFFSFKTGMGANTYGYLVYFILSPFNLLTLIAGKGNVIYMVNIVFVLKLMTISGVAIWFMKKFFKLDSRVMIAFAIAYTLCGYALFNYTYMSFLDNLIYAPIFVYTFTLLKDKNKLWPMAIMIFMMILTCFSLGCFTLLYYLAIFMGYVFFCVDKKDRKSLILKTMCSTLIGIGLSSGLLVSAFMQYMKSSRNTGFNLFAVLNRAGIATRLGTAITEIALVFFVILYLIKMDKKNGFNRFLIFMCMLTLMTIISDDCMNFFNGGSVYGYFSRFGFVGAMLNLTMACKYFTELKIDNTYSKPITICQYIFVSIMSIIGVIILLLSYSTMKGVLSSQGLLGGGLFVYFFLLMIILIPIFVVIFNKKSLGKHLFTMIMIAMIAMSGGMTFMHVGGDIPLDIDEYIISQEIKSKIKDNARVKAWHDGYLSNNVAANDLNSINTFSSLVHGNLTESARLLGMYTATNMVNSSTGTILTDILLGNKYILTKYEYNKSYAKLLAYDGEYYLYENIYCENLAKVIPDNIVLTDDIIANQQTLYNAFGGEGELFTEVELEYHLEEDKLISNGDKVANISDKYGRVYIDNEYDEYELLYLVQEKDAEAIDVNMCEVYPTIDHAFYEILPGQEYFKVYGEMDVSNYKLYKLDLLKIDTLMFETYEVTEKYNKITSKITLDRSACVMLPYVDIDDYKVYVNGKEHEFSGKMSHLMTLNLTEGDHDIEIVYESHVFRDILLGVAIGLVIIGIALIINKFIPKINDRFICIAFAIFSYVYLAVMTVFPTGISILKIFGIL